MCGQSFVFRRKHRLHCFITHPGGKVLATFATTSQATDMYYAILAEDLPGTLEQRRQAHPAHVERLKALLAQGRVLIAGPHPSIDAEDPGKAGFSGSLIVAEFESLETAKAWVSEDPYVTAGVYGQVTVKPFKKVLP